MLLPKIVRLIQIVNDPDEVRQTYAYAKARYRAFPSDGCAAFCSSALRRADINVRFELWAQTLAEAVEARGWRRVSRREEPRAGDVFVTQDINGQPGADHMGVVAADGRFQGRFRCADNQLGSAARPYLRNIGPGPKTPIAYWLRAPEAEVESLREALLADLEIHPEKEVLCPDCENLPENESAEDVPPQEYDPEQDTTAPY